jgi:DNA-directed RNA polymerase sigma subunit (sigma70/sigma32)
MTETLKAVRLRNRQHIRARERERQALSALREAIVAARADGHTLVSIGNILGVSAQRVEQIAKQ